MSADPNEVWRLRIVSGANAVDSVQARLTSPLVVEVRSTRGNARRDVSVRFVALPTDDSSRTSEAAITVAPEATDAYAAFASSTTDAIGLAKVRVAMGTVAGTGKIVVTAPDLQQAETASYSVVPGNLARIVVSPRDTAIAIGKLFAPNIKAIDRVGNRHASPVTFAVGPPTCQLDASGRLTSTRPARCKVVARAESKTDSLYTSVVPNATLIVVWHTAANGAPLLVTVDLDGSNLRRVTRLTDPDAYPTATSDASRIVFQSFGRLFVADSSGSNTPVFPSPAPFTRSVYARLSRAGDWIYFDGGGPNYPGGIYRIRPDGSMAERLAPRGPGYFVGSMPDPSPDGSRVAYHAGDIHIVSVASGKIDTTKAYGFFPRWSPLGDRIAFLTPNSVNVMDADGQNERVVAYLPRFIKGPQTPDWSADGQWLLMNGDAVLSIVNADSGEAIPLPWSNAFIWGMFIR